MTCGTNPTINVVFPKPRRVNCNSKCVMKLPFSNQAEPWIQKPMQKYFWIASQRGWYRCNAISIPLVIISPPFFNESPPSGAMNPLIHDVTFANYGKQLTCLSPSSISPSTSASPLPSSSCKGRSCARARLLGQKTQAPARVEGFDCQNPHLVAMA